jgi:hypothetical protein
MLNPSVRELSLLSIFSKKVLHCPMIHLAFWYWDSPRFDLGHPDCVYTQAPTGAGVSHQAMRIHWHQSKNSGFILVTPVD